jgi:hypothetical protein
MSALVESLVLSLALVGQGSEQAPSASNREGEQQFLKDKAAELSVQFSDRSGKPLTLAPEPVLRFSNAERAIGALDGVTFLWLERARPVAAASLSIRRLTNSVYRECTSLTSSPLECKANGASAWAPKTGGLLARPLSDAPSPAKTKPQRLTQMRAIARRFSASCYHPRTDDATELRLLPQPLYRYADEKSDILDGALFAFVVTNDPELFLLLEAVTGATDELEWRYSLARMSSQKLSVRLGDTEIWSVPNYWQDATEDRRTGPYVESEIGKYSISENGATKN